MIKDLLQSHQRALHNTLKEGIQKLWVEITFITGYTVRTFNDFQTAVRQPKSREEEKKIAICLNFRIIFVKTIKKFNEQHGFCLDKRKVETQSGSTTHYVSLLVH